MLTRYKVRINRSRNRSWLLTDEDYTNVVGYGTEPDPESKSRVLTFEDEDAAARAGNEYCDEAPTHPVFGAPGFEIVAVHHRVV